MRCVYSIMDSKSGSTSGAPNRVIYSRYVARWRSACSALDYI